MQTPSEPADLKLDPLLDPQLAALTAALNSITGKCRWALGDAGVTDAALLWQPSPPNGRSVGALLLHTAESESYWLTEVIEGRARSKEQLRTLLAAQTRSFESLWPTPPARPLAWYYEQQDLVRAGTRRAVAELNDAARAGSDEEGERYTLRWVLAHVAWHESYHNGQAVVLAEQFAASAGR